MQPFCAPWVRRMRVSLRVSMPAMATVPSRARYASSVDVAEIGVSQRQILDDQAGGMDLRRLDVLLADAVAAHVRIRQGDDLLAVARVGEDFLVTSERGVEHHFADRVASGADRGAGEDRAVCECKDCGGQDRQQRKLRGAVPSFARLPPRGCLAGPTGLGRAVRTAVDGTGEASLFRRSEVSGLIAGKPVNYSGRRRACHPLVMAGSHLHMRSINSSSVTRN